MPESPIFSHLSLSASRIFITPKNVWFLASLEVPAFLCLPKDPCYLQDVWFLATWSMPPSLLISSYLPAITQSQ